MKAAGVESGGRVGKGVQLSVTMAVRDPLKARGTEEGMGRETEMGQGEGRGASPF